VSNLVTRCSSTAPASQSSTSTSQQPVELNCTSLAFGGRGVCRSADGGLVTFVPFALPGETLLAAVTHVHANYAEAEHVETLRPSPEQVQPSCMHFRQCGGCALQHYSYNAQLAAKALQVNDALTRVGAFADAHALVLPPVGAEKQLRYRNKVEFTAVSEASSPPRLGLLRQGCAAPVDPHALVEVVTCELQHVEGDAVLATVRSLVEEHATLAGILRRVMIRTSAKGDADSDGVDIQVDFMTSSSTALNASATAALATIAQHLAAAHPAVVSIVNTRLAGVDDVDSDDDSEPRARKGQRRGSKPAVAPTKSTTHLLHGVLQLAMRLGGMTFHVSSRSFFQVNPSAAQKLLSLGVARAAALTGKERVLDLFCGCGAMSLPLIGSMASLLGIDSCEDAIRDAARAARDAGVNNKASFRVGDLMTLDSLLMGASSPPRFDVVIVDPARAGLSPRLISFLRSCGTQRLVYVSCNPATQARDLKALCAASSPGGPFALQWVMPFDLFPMTGHIEAVACLTRTTGM
jgi:23S rRNA (uracil1939-C5)-methyltransferase